MTYDSTGTISSGETQVPSPSFRVGPDHGTDVDKIPSRVDGFLGRIQGLLRRRDRPVMTTEDAGDVPLYVIDSSSKSSELYCILI